MQVTRPFTFYSGAVLRQGALSGMHTCDQMDTATNKTPSVHSAVAIWCFQAVSSFLSTLLPQNIPNKKLVPNSNQQDQQNHLCDQRFPQVPFVQRWSWNFPSKPPTRSSVQTSYKRHKKESKTSLLVLVLVLATAGWKSSPERAPTEAAAHTLPCQH